MANDPKSGFATCTLGLGAGRLRGCMKERGRMWEASVLESPMGGNQESQVFTDGQFMMDGRSPSKTRDGRLTLVDYNPRKAVSAEETASFHGFRGGRFRVAMDWTRGWIDLIDGMGQDAR